MTEVADRNTGKMSENQEILPLDRSERFVASELSYCSYASVDGTSKIPVDNAVGAEARVKEGSAGKVTPESNKLTEEAAVAHDEVSPSVETGEVWAGADDLKASFGCAHHNLQDIVDSHLEEPVLDSLEISAKESNVKADLKEEATPLCGSAPVQDVFQDAVSGVFEMGGDAVDVIMKDKSADEDAGGEESLSISLKNERHDVVLGNATVEESVMTGIQDAGQHYLDVSEIVQNGETEVDEVVSPTKRTITSSTTAVSKVEIEVVNNVMDNVTGKIMDETAGKLTEDTGEKRVVEILDRFADRMADVVAVRMADGATTKEIADKIFGKIVDKTADKIADKFADMVTDEFTHKMADGMAGGIPEDRILDEIAHKMTDGIAEGAQTEAPRTGKTEDRIEECFETTDSNEEKDIFGTEIIAPSTREGLDTASATSSRALSAPLQKFAGPESDLGDSEVAGGATVDLVSDSGAQKEAPGTGKTEGRIEECFETTDNNEEKDFSGTEIIAPSTREGLDTASASSSQALSAPLQKFAGPESDLGDSEVPGGATVDLVSDSGAQKEAPGTGKTEGRIEECFETTDNNEEKDFSGTEIIAPSTREGLDTASATSSQALSAPLQKFAGPESDLGDSEVPGGATVDLVSDSGGQKEAPGTGKIEDRIEECFETTDINEEKDFSGTEIIAPSTREGLDTASATSSQALSAPLQKFAGPESDLGDSEASGGATVDLVSDSGVQKGVSMIGNTGGRTEETPRQSETTAIMHRVIMPCSRFDEERPLSELERDFGERDHPQTSALVFHLEQELQRAKELKEKFEAQGKDYEEVREKYQVLNEDYGVLQISNKKLNEDYERLRISNKKLKADYEGLQISNQILNKDYAELLMSHKNLNHVLEKNRIYYQEWNSRMQDVLKANDDCRRADEHRVAHIRNLDNQLGQKTSQNEKLQGDILKLQDQNNRLQQDLSKYEQQYANKQCGLGGSYLDDTKAATPALLVSALNGVKDASNNFVKVLRSSFSNPDLEAEFRKQCSGPVSRPGHIKFQYQQFVCSVLFENFGNEFFQNYVSDPAGTSKVASSPATYFDQYQTHDLKTFDTVEKMIQNDLNIDPSLPKFCLHSFLSLMKHLNPGNIDRGMALVQTVRQCQHPRNSKLYVSFCKVAVSVWLLHRLAFSFLQPAELTLAQPGERFDLNRMQSVVPLDDPASDEELQQLQVGFCVLPGFRIGNSAIPCEVYVILSRSFSL